MLAKGLGEKIEELKNGLIYNDEFQEIFNYFFDVVTADTNFRTSSKALSDSPFVTTAIKHTLKSVYEKMLYENKGKVNPPSEDQMAFLIIQHIKEADFYHGPIAMFGGMGCYFYFEKQSIGLLNIKFPDSDRVWYSRFTALEGNKGALPQLVKAGEGVRN